MESAIEILRRKIDQYDETDSSAISKADIDPGFIEYNEQLAEHWTAGAPSRGEDIEVTEQSYFRNVMEGMMRRDGISKVLLFDLGAGNGKVIDWFAGIVGALMKEPNHKLFYFYTDISSAMKSMARRKFEEFKLSFPGLNLVGLLPLLDVTRLAFTPDQWDVLSREFHIIGSICAGGTIGNFGRRRDVGYEAQMKVVDALFRHSDVTFITFLDPLKIVVSMEEYREFGISTGMFDELKVHTVRVDPDSSAHRQGASLKLRLHRRAAFRRDLMSFVEEIEGLRESPFFVVIEMYKGGAHTGQITRHYSLKYAREVMCRDFEFGEVVEAGRANITSMYPRRGLRGRG